MPPAELRIALQLLGVTLGGCFLSDRQVETAWNERWLLHQVEGGYTFSLSGKSKFLKTHTDCGRVEA